MSAVEGTQAPPPGRTWLTVFAGAAVAVPLLWALYTGHVWEDYFITFKHSQNLADGQGLVYRPGERVHGFTSPLGVLLPALCYWATGRGSYLAALWLFRALSAAAYAGGGVLFLKALRCGGASRFVAIAFAVLYLLDAKAVDFSVNGMETGFMLLFLGWGMYLLARDEPRDWWALGLAWGGLMWTRPDGSVYVAALAAAALLFAGGPRRPRLAALAKGAAVCAAVYLPWFLWAWGYYGSPVPNTIRAKANYGPGYHDWGQVLARTVASWPQRTAEVYRPLNSSYFGGWPPWPLAVPMYLGLFSAVYWLFPVKDRHGRAASFCFAVLTLYLAFLTTPFSWYFPPVAVCGLLVLTRGSSAYARSLGWAAAGFGRLAVTWGLLTGFLLLAGLALYVFAQTAREMKIQQREIEWGNRVPLALWLKEHVGERERVYSESLGYVGYFSGVTILDYPGLASPEVVRAARQLPNDFATVGLRLEPEWMVLRPREQRMMAAHPEFAKRYRPVMAFDVTDRLNAYPDLPGRGYVAYDAVFTVYRRVSGERGPTGGGS